jgi:hypothetical protein
MKKLICLVLLFSNLAMASNCDWSTIKQLPDGGYEYSPALNLCVGNLVQQSKVQTKQISDLTTAVDLKDAALTAADQRTLLWTTAAENEQDRMNKLQADQKHSDWLYFALGVVTTFAAGYGAAALARH